MPRKRYAVAGCKPWNRKVFQTDIQCMEGEWFYLGAREELTVERIREIDPDLIFFLHWSWKVPDEIVNNYECVCFHMTDVPYGRGGSPLQNLILRGHTRTRLTALKMTPELDAGPVYLKRDLDLAGSAQEIYVRATLLSAEMIASIIREKPVPVSQSGDPVVFKRRRPEESEISGIKDPEELYDFIRMLDAEGYPRAFFSHDGFHFEFSRASLQKGVITGQVKITRKGGGEE
jgi:methionyl-tRNA formyltransferase